MRYARLAFGLPELETEDPQRRPLAVYVVEPTLNVQSAGPHILMPRADVHPNLVPCALRRVQFPEIECVRVKRAD